MPYDDAMRDPSGASEDDPALAALEARAQAAWPAVRLPALRFRTLLAERFPGPGRLSERLATVRIEELYLAFACAEGSHEAITSFEREYRADIARALSRLGLTPAESDDVAQAMRERLFVAKDILKFSGQGKLRSWVLSTATRAGLNQRSRGRKPSDGEDVLAALSASGDVELDVIKLRYKDDFKAAFALALASLAPRDRTLLAQIYVDKLSAADIATIRGVNRSTVGRWLALAYETVLTRTQATLQAQLGADPSEVASMFRALTSQIELSVQRILRPGPGEP